MEHHKLRQEHKVLQHFQLLVVVVFLLMLVMAVAVEQGRVEQLILLVKAEVLDGMRV